MSSQLDIHLLNGGSFVATADMVFANAEKTPWRCYCWVFHIHNPRTNSHILWDVGMSDNRDDYSSYVHNFWDYLQATAPSKSIVEQLAEIGVEAESIDTVIFSHAHFDHSRPIKADFPNARAYFGPGTLKHCSPGHFTDSHSEWDGRLFDPERKTENTFEPDDSTDWKQLGAFEKALDYWGDGSFWLVQAPGHLPGNMFAMARTHGGECIVLGGDCCHSRLLFDGKSDFGVFQKPTGEIGTLHHDTSTTKSTLQKLKAFEREFNAHVAFAHDTEWIKEGTDEVLLSLIAKDLREEILSKVPKGEAI